MRFDLLSHKEGVRRLILLFSGWSTGVEYYRGINRSGWDVGVVTDYTDMSLDTSFLDNYDTVWVFAWSLGVKAAAVALPADKIQKSIAINGTLSPVDDVLGIPVAIYDGTMENLSSRNLNKFHIRMVGDRAVYDQLFCREFSDEEIVLLKRELEVLKGAECRKDRLPWKVAYLSRLDKIFPYSNMRNFWDSEDVVIINSDTPHCVSLQNIISEMIPDINLIAEKFGAASETYEANASAQKIVAQKLCKMISVEGKGAEKILEIGPGKGVFTRMYSHLLSPLQADYVDLVALEPFGIAGKERYFTMDAEEYILNTNEDYDYILSSSVVQWFSDLDAFVRNCGRALYKRGVLLFSTYSKGNLYELDEYRPAPLIYYNVEEIEAIVKRYFKNVEVKSEEIKLEFATTRELLMHLKNTGVNIISPLYQISPFRLKNLKTLTYHPVYVVARNPIPN